MKSSVVIICPGTVVSGGPEALHQLGHAIRLQGGEARMCYFPFDREFAVKSAYSGYGVPLCRFDEIGTARIVLPEARTGFSRLFSPEQVTIWWLSVGNYGGACQAGDRVADPERHRPLDEMRNLQHLAQSQYAQAFLRDHGIAAGMLGDYLAAEHLAPPGTGDRRPIVMFNASKDKFAPQLAQLLPEYSFVGLKGLSSAGVAVQLRTARLYIDFGNHPGRDRIPREAAMAGCCVITGKQGAAAVDADLQIPVRYKLDETEPDFLDKAARTIRSVMTDYDSCVEGFATYRRLIAGERQEFLKQVGAAFL